MWSRGAHDGSRAPYIEAPDVGATHVVALSAASRSSYLLRRGAHDGARGAHDGAPLRLVAVA